MAEEASSPTGQAGTAIGAASLFIQVFQGCLTGFSLWKHDKNVGTDALIFKVRLDLQAAKFRAWAFEWGLHKGTDSPYFRDERFKTYNDEAVQAVLTIYSILADLGGLQVENPLLAAAGKHEVTPAASFSNMHRFSDPDSIERKYWVKKMETIREDVSLHQRLRWALESGTADKILENLERMIGDLYQLFPPVRNDPAVPVIMNQSLPTEQLPVLNEINPSTVDDPLLIGLARLKAATTDLQARASALEQINVNRKMRDLKGAKYSGKERRSIGRFQNEDVLVEWKAVDATLAEARGDGVVFGTVMDQRIKNIARLLRSDNKPEELRTLTCLGVVTTTGTSDFSKQYGMLYQIPSTTYSTLSDALETSKNDFFLEDRFSLAVVLAKAMLYLHLAGWLHKGIRGDNIVFFVQDDTKYDLSKPYLVGFEYSRESRPNAQTEDVLEDTESNLYRHPEVQGVPRELAEQSGLSETQKTRPPFSAKHDIYSLGIVLLEIGLMKSAWSMLETAKTQQDYKSHSAANFRAWLLESQVPCLGPLAGRSYMEAVRSCITGELSLEGRTLAEAFYVDVVQKVTGPSSVDIGP
ncbi:uncharacterized protein JN550_007171 [Neoarthrinium moseri]|uniref:uncharacterized protein n=1 Tax=Neoarthrinium moseri TaxID=1658444 RepID=UPI001FDD313C|nr:uncharacterized protein JN550_007171 [Neoarthrinium moseri]KAI1867119.1 hypothetical protein JN550_007171 [Neoarthrinium moseri]